jgi:hypothetical protein
MVQSLLPEKGSFTNLKLVRVAREVLSFDDLENKKLQFRKEGDRLEWVENVVEDKDIKLGEVVTEMMKKTLKELDQKEELTAQQLTLYSKFMGGS